VSVVLADQQDFFFFLLFIFIKYANSSLCVITTLGINLSKGLYQYLIMNRSRRTCTLVQA
jgi:hypothetical protein